MFPCIYPSVFSSHMTGELESEVILCVCSSLLPPGPPVQLLVVTIAMVGGLGAKLCSGSCSLELHVLCCFVIVREKATYLLKCCTCSRV